MQPSSLLGSILLISGTAIGAGMLALPLATAKAGFLPTVLVFTLCNLFTTLSALLLLEVNLWLPKKCDLITMSKQTLGKPGQYIAWSTYLLLLYALISAYLKVSSSWLLDIIQDHYHTSLSLNLSVFIVITILAIILYYGTHLVDTINRFLAIGLFISYLVLVTKSVPYVSILKLQHIQFSETLPALPLIMTSFGFAIIVPSLTDYLQRDTKALTHAILWGSVLTLFIYLVWELVTLGTLPLEGKYGLLALGAKKDQDIALAFALERLIKNPWITTAAHLFSVFALLTSFLGVSLSLFHFLADGLKVLTNTFKRRFFLLCATLLPPLLLTLFYPAGFARLLSFAGIFVAILLGMLPACMAWAGRYHLKMAHGFRIPGGKILLIIINLFFFSVIVQELYNCISL